MRIYFLAIALLVSVGAAQAAYVYQEFANVGVGYGTSGNGTYDSSSVTIGDDYLHVTYTKPPTASSALWQIQLGENSTYPYNQTPPVVNYTINASCLNYEPLTLRFWAQSQGFTGLSFGECFNSTTWVQVTPTITRVNSSGVTPNADSLMSSSLTTLWYDGLYDNRSNVVYNPAGAVYSVQDRGPTRPYMAGAIGEEAVHWYFNNSINMSFYDEGTGNLLSGTTVTYYVTGSGNSFSGSTSTGSVVVSDLYEGDYVITYSASGYEQRSNVLSVDSVSENVGLYLLNSSDASNVLIGVYNTFTNRVGGAAVYVQKKNLSGTNYFTVDSCVTDARGECLINLELYDTTYRFLIYYGGFLKLNSNDTKVSQSTLSFIINLQNFNVADLFKIASINGNITNNHYSFTFNYTDGYSIISSACLETVKRTGSSLVTTATNCSSTTTGSLTLSFNNATGDEWIGNGYVVLSSNSRRYDLDSDSYVVSDFKSQFGRVGLFYFGFLLLGTMVFSAMYSIVASMVMAGVGVWVLNALGFISIGMSAAVSLLIIIVIYIIAVKNT